MAGSPSALQRIYTAKHLHSACASSDGRFLLFGMGRGSIAAPGPCAGVEAAGRRRAQTSKPTVNRHAAAMILPESATKPSGPCFKAENRTAVRCRPGGSGPRRATWGTSSRRSEGHKGHEKRARSWLRTVSASEGGARQGNQAREAWWSVHQDPSGSPSPSFSGAVMMQPASMHPVAGPQQPPRPTSLFTAKTVLGREHCQSGGGRSPMRRSPALDVAGADWATAVSLLDAGGACRRVLQDARVSLEKQAAWRGRLGESCPKDQTPSMNVLGLVCRVSPLGARRGVQGGSVCALGAEDQQSEGCSITRIMHRRVSAGVAPNHYARRSNKTRIAARPLCCKEQRAKAAMFVSGFADACGTCREAFGTEPHVRQPSLPAKRLRERESSIPDHRRTEAISPSMWRPHKGTQDDRGIEPMPKYHRPPQSTCCSVLVIRRYRADCAGWPAAPPLVSLTPKRCPAYIF
ncbi:hypothetical protein M011DRAFT_458770 [Sporormia fimetaria CBS 119925]|uniref:Uncharacterized protein n=1 Tax=Sporormia fimetaria CBS 119925 TaxID=1340428 RepID=A0A6A6VBN0_9PLEO|nr:hypothetical protein M011DRAFT_458770 [Sporormia fimetaria CBS 119925]